MEEILVHVFFQMFFFSLKTKDTWTYFQCNYLVQDNLKENLISSNFLGESYKIISVII